MTGCYMQKKNNPSLHSIINTHSFFMKSKDFSLPYICLWWEIMLSVLGPVRVRLHNSSLHEGLVGFFFWSFPPAGSHFYCLWAATSWGISPPEQKHRWGIGVGPNCSCWRKGCWETSETPSFYFHFPRTPSPLLHWHSYMKVHEVLDKTCSVVCQAWWFVYCWLEIQEKMFKSGTWSTC